MTPTEAKGFFEKVFITFPGLKEWLKSIGDPSATVAVWSRTLERVTLDEAFGVLDGWIDGTIENPPVGFRREMFALEVRAVAMKLRGERVKELDREEQWRKTNRGNYQPTAAFRSIAKPFNEILSVRAKMMNGEISNAECEQQEKQIIERAFA